MQTAELQSLIQDINRLSGLGLGTTKRLLELGAHVAVIDLNLPEKGNELEKSQCRFFKADVSNTSDVEKATSEIVNWSETSGHQIAAIVCCAGFLGPQKVCLKQIYSSLLTMGLDPLQARGSNEARTIQESY
jgi:NAD(P)-dependent dehydrogenase (short-subunit alcohol dehydrogenase family)